IAERIRRVKCEKGVERLSRQERLALEAEEAVRLLKETSARTTIIPVIINTATGDIVIGATGGVSERIENLIDLTFGEYPQWTHPALFAGALAGQTISPEHPAFCIIDD